MKDIRTNHLIIAITFAALALSVSVGAWVAYANQREVEESIRARLESERALLFSLAEITARNGADADITSMVPDCSRRSEYESLLVQLASLDRKDLLSIEGLNESCGDFFALRKSLMVAKMERELENYDSLLSILSALTSHDLDAYESATWHELLTLEQTRRDLLTELNTIQTSIIAALIAGNGPESNQVTALAERAQEINDRFIVHAKQADEIRKSLRH